MEARRNIGFRLCDVKIAGTVRYTAGVATKRCSYRLIAHTGDAAIQLRAPHLEGLFESAARGVFALLAEGRVRRRPVLSTRIESSDAEALLVDWLNELIFLHTVGRWMLIPTRLSIAAGRRLQATLVGEQFDTGRHHARREVKAATFHGLRLERQAGLWRARVVFDL
jgi:SHS2 domain-containing protein